MNEIVMEGLSKMSKKRNRRRFYPEFYTDDELKRNEEVRNENEEQENVGDGVIAEFHSAHVPEITEETVSTEKIAEVEPVDEENYNGLIYPRKPDAAAVFKQIENMQKDYIDKKFNVFQTTKNIMNNEVSNINNIDDNMNPNPNEISVEIPQNMVINEQSSFNRMSPVSRQTNEEPVTSSSNPIVYNLNNTPVNLPVFFNSPELSNSAELIELSETQNDEIKRIFDTVSENLNEINENMLLSIPTFAELTETESIAETEIEQNVESIETMENLLPPESEVIIPEIIQRSQIIPFDREKAIEYARRWALDRNSNFYNFDDIGGDCTNYISQILLAGGCRMDKSSSLYGWYYNNTNDKSPSWTGVEQLFNYLIKEREHGIIALEIDASEVEAGDIVQLSFNGKTFQHTPFIISARRNQLGAVSFEQIKVCAHSFDSDNRSLDTYQWKKIRFIRILGFKESF
jgi:hypothetical protein